MARIPFIMVLITLSIGVVKSDFAEDQKECKEQLQIVSPCLSYVSGQYKSPSTSCCTQLRNNANKIKRCLCVLVKDRNEPSLGFKINATLALILPSLCHAPNKASDCPGLLKLAPNSTEAQVFEQFASSYETESNIPAASGSPPGSSSSNSSRQSIWLGGVLIKIVITIFLITFGA